MKNRIKFLSVIFSFIFIFLVGVLCISNIFISSQVIYAEEIANSDEISDPSQEDKDTISQISREEISVDANSDTYTFTEDVQLGKAYKVNENIKKIDGNGKTITLTNLNCSIFDSLNGVELYNLTIQYNEKINDQQGGVQPTASIMSLTDTNENKINTKSIIAEKIQNTNIHDIKIVGFSMNIKEDQSNTEKNIGLLSETISNSTISQIWIDNCEITGNLTYNSNVGYLAGKVTGGTVIKNCLIENSSLDLCIKNDFTSFNYGGLVGYAENITAQNNIVNLTNSNPLSPQTISLNSDINPKKVNFGGLVGKFSSNQNRIYNNLVMINSNSINLQSSLSGSNIGALAGETESNVAISGFLTCYQENIIGKSDIDLNYGLTNRISYLDINYSLFNSDQYWSDVAWCIWDIENIWDITDKGKTPKLQVFEEFTVSFIPEDSNNNLGFDVKPENTIIKGLISNSETETTLKDEDSKINISYGETIYIYVEILNENNYDKFFYFDGLALNGNKVFDIKLGSVQGYEDIEYVKEDGKSYFKIKNFKAKYAGDYSIILGKNEFRFTVKSYNEGSEFESFYPGGIYTNLDQTVNNELIVSLYFGDKITLYSTAIDKDYSDDARWYLHKKDISNVDDELIETELFKFNSLGEPSLSAGENYFLETYGRLDITLNEKCILLKNDVEINKSVDESHYTIDAELNLRFEKGVKEVTVIIRDNTGKAITQNIAQISINGKSDRILWDEDNLCYIAKVPYGSVSPVIKLEGLETDYAFVSWDYEIGQLGVVDDDNLSGGFEVSDNDDDLIIYCTVKSTKKIMSQNLTWLWILLGTVAGIGLIVVIIILIRRSVIKRKNSYKRYYY